jgi:hypothetical protein
VQRVLHLGRWGNIGCCWPSWGVWGGFCDRVACRICVKILQYRGTRQTEHLNTNFLCVECSRRRDESNGARIGTLKCVVVARRGGVRFSGELTRYIGLYHTRFRLLLTLSHAACGHPPTALQVKTKTNATVAKARKKRKETKEHKRKEKNTSAPPAAPTQTTRTRTPLLHPPPSIPTPPATPHPLHHLPSHSLLFLPSLHPHIAARPGNPGPSSAER